MKGVAGGCALFAMKIDDTMKDDDTMNAESGRGLTCISSF